MTKYNALLEALEEVRGLGLSEEIVDLDSTEEKIANAYESSRDTEIRKAAELYFADESDSYDQEDWFLLERTLVDLGELLWSSSEDIRLSDVDSAKNRVKLAFRRMIQ